MSRPGSDLLWNSSQPGGNSGLWLFLSWQTLSARGKAAWSVTPYSYWQKAKGTLKSIPRTAEHQLLPGKKSQRTACGYSDTERTLLFYGMVRLSTTVKGNQLTNPTSLKLFIGNTKAFSVLKCLPLLGNSKITDFLGSLKPKAVLKSSCLQCWE